MISNIAKPPAADDQDISFKEVLVKLKEWFLFLLSKWYIILLAGIFGAAAGFLFAYLKNPEYKAELTFVLEDSKGGALSAYAGIASQFGIDLGGAATSGVFTGDNIIEFLRSRLLIEKTLLSPVIEEGKVKSLADLYIDAYELRDNWKDVPALDKLNFPITVSRDKFSLQQDSILHKIQETIVDEHLQISKPDKKLSFIAVVCQTENETFSKLFTERLVKEAVDFYTQTKIKQYSITVNTLQAKADSVEKLLNRSTYTMARSQDMNLNPARSMAQVSIEVAGRDKIMLQTIYAEVIKNLELSKMAMSQQTPIIQIVDAPILPLEKVKLSKAIALVAGGLLFGFLAVATLITRKLFKEIMK